MRSYTLGNELVFAASFLDPTTRQAVEPSTVVLELLDPTGLVVTVPTGLVGAGSYRAVFTPDIPGIWTIRWAGVGAVAVATEYKFEIKPSAFQV